MVILLLPDLPLLYIQRRDQNQGNQVLPYLVPLQLDYKEYLIIPYFFVWIQQEFGYVGPS